MLDGGGPAGTAGQPLRGAVFANANGAPGALLGRTEQVTIAPGQAAGLVKLAFDPPLRLAPGSYWLGLHGGELRDHALPIDRRRRRPALQCRHLLRRHEEPVRPLGLRDGDGPDRRHRRSVAPTLRGRELQPRLGAGGRGLDRVGPDAGPRRVLALPRRVLRARAGARAGDARGRLRRGSRDPRPRRARPSRRQRRRRPDAAAGGARGRPRRPLRAGRRGGAAVRGRRLRSGGRLQLADGRRRHARRGGRGGASARAGRADGRVHHASVSPKRAGSTGPRPTRRS